MSVAGRRWLWLGVCTALFVPMLLYFLFMLAWVFPARNGYPVCDPIHQPWCEHNPAVTVSWYAGVVGAGVSLLCLVVAYVLPKRVRLWWPWALAALLLLPVSIVTLGSVFRG
jgi:hypothetical protein